MPMQRRQLLKTAGIVATGSMVGLAGCSGGGDGDDGSSDDGGDGSGDGSSDGSGDGSSDGSGDDSSDGGNGGGETTTVEMRTESGNYLFDPIGLYVEEGDTVVFENVSGSHSAVAYSDGNGPATTTRIPEGAEAFGSQIFSEEGATYEVTFDTAGTYDYFCTPHKTLGMVGRIVVGEPGGPAEGSMPPDGDVPDSQTIVDQGSVSYDDFTG
jgi:plastocyanin